MTEKKPRRPRDPNQLAKMIVDIATGDEPAQPKSLVSEAKRKATTEAAKRRAKALSPAKRSEIASVAAKIRWRKD